MIYKLLFDKGTSGFSEKLLHLNAEIELELDFIYIINVLNMKRTSCCGCLTLLHEMTTVFGILLSHA